MAMTAFEIFGVLKLDSSDFKKGLSSAEGMASKIGGGIGRGLSTAARIGFSAVAAATTAVVGLGTTAVQVGSQFDTAMGGVAATMGQTMEEMEGNIGSVDTAYGHFEGTLRDFAMYMGQNTVFSASQAAGALNYMALAGYDAQKSMEMLPSVLNMAAAGSMDLAQASDMVTDISAAMGLDFQRTGLMVDEFAKAASTGNTSVEQLGEAFLRVGGLARELNGGMLTLSDGTQAEIDGTEELEIAFTAMANAGVKGSEAGTHMRNMLLKLSSPTKDGTKALEEMGVSVFDAEGKMRSLSSIFGDLNTQLGQMTQAERISIISDLFNTRDMASAEALLNAVGQDWDRIGESILNAEGAAQQMSETKLDNLAGDMTLFKSALETAQITMNDQLSPTLREFVQFGTKGLQDLTTAFQEGGLSGAMEALGTILSDGLNMIIEKAPEMVQAGMDLLGALGQGLLDNLPMIIDASVQIIGQLVQGLIVALPALASGAAEIIAGLGKALIEMLPELIPVVQDLIMQFVQFIQDNIDGIIDGALAIIMALVNGLIEMLPELIPAAVDIILKIVEALLDNIDLLVDAAISLIIGLAEGLINALPILLDKAPEIIQKLAIAIANNLPKIAEAAVKIVITLVEGIIKNLPKLIESGLKIIGSLVGGIFSALGQLWDAGGRVIDEIWNSIKNGISKAADWGRDLISSFINGITGGLSNIGSAMSGVASTIASYIHFSEPDIGPLSNFHTFAPDMMDMFIKGIDDNTGRLEDQIKSSFDFGGLINASMGDVNMALSDTRSGGYGNGITINVYGAEGQDVNELAEIVSRRIAYETRKQGAAWGMA